MNRILAFISYLFIFLVGSISSVSAAPIRLCPTNSNFQKLCDISLANTGEIIRNIIILLLIIAVIVAVIFLIIGGIKWIVSGGDKSAVEGARNTIVAAIIGLIVALLAFVIIRIVLNFLGVENQEFTLPPLL